MGHRVRITAGFYQPHGGTKVEIDGVEIQELVDVTFRHRAQEVAELTLVIYPSEIELVGHVPDVHVSRSLEEALKGTLPENHVPYSRVSGLTENK